MKYENPWQLNKRTLDLSIKWPDIRKGPGRYDVDLKQCTTSAEVLDWIMQVEEKRWATDQVLAQLLRELDRILQPQRTLCSEGKEKGPIDIKKVLKENKIID